MCVVMIADKIRPTEVMVRKAWADNDDGSGAAWREDEDTNDPKNPTRTLVHWKKGLNLEEIVKMAAELPMPFVLHFRRNSVGGIRASLTHPFPINENGDNFLNGKTNGLVLFHNGHWGKWKETLFETVVKFGKKVPNGKWSDTRAMAWLAAVYGLGFLDILDEKTVAFGPRTIDTVLGTGWKEINGVLCSNDFFMHKYVQPESCRVQSCTNNTGLVDGWCQVHRNFVRSGRTEHSFPNQGTPPTGTTSIKSDLPLIAQNDANKRLELVTGFDDKGLETGGSSAVIPFASLRVAEQMFAQDRAVSKKFINKVRFNYQRVFDLPNVRLTAQQKQLLEQTSPTIIIRG